MSLDSFRLPRAEAVLYAVCAALAAVACAGPHVAAGAGAHAFADARTLWGIPHAIDVLSNLPFALAGLLGLTALARAAHRRAVQGGTLACAALFFGGLLLTTGGSALYHWQPTDATLLADRAGMLVAFAGMLGLAVNSRLGARAASVMVATVLAGGALALHTWAASGQLLPWAVLQGGGMLVLLGLALRQPEPGRLAVSLWAVVGWYAVAKLLELGDHAVFGWTDGWVAGHSLKHVLAALAAWPVIAALRAVPPAIGQPGGYLARCVRGLPWRGRAARKALELQGTMAAGARGEREATPLAEAARRDDHPSTRSMA